MSAGILVVDDEADVAELFRQRFRREARQGTYVMHFANSGEDALELLSDGIEPQLIVILSDIDPPSVLWTPMLGFRARRTVSDEHNAADVSRDVQAPGG